MSVRLRTAVECLSRSGGQRLAETGNVGIAEQTGRPGTGRSKGALYVLVEAAGVAKDETERQLVDLLITEYDKAPGSITSGLRQAITAANARLYGQNQKSLPENRAAAGVTLAVIRESDVFVAQAGPSLAYVLHQDTFQRMPIDSPWLSPERAGSFPHMVPLGKRPEVDPDLFHSPLQRGDSMVVCTVALAQRVPQAQFKEIMSKGAVTLMMRQIGSQAGGLDFTALALEILEQSEVDEEAEAAAAAEEGEPEPAQGLVGRLREDWQVMTEDVGGLVGRLLQPIRNRGSHEPVDVPEMAPAPGARRAQPPRPAQQMEQAAEGYEGPPHQPAGMTGRLAAGTALPAEEPYTQPVLPLEVPPVRAPAQPLYTAEAIAGEPGTSRITRGGAAGAQGGLGSRLAGALRAAGERFRPVSEPEEYEEAAEESPVEAAAPEETDGESLVGRPWRERPRSGGRGPLAALRGIRLPVPALGGRLTMATVAILAVTAAIVGGLALVRYQEDQQRNQRFVELLASAQTKRSAVTPTMDKAAARTALAQAQQAVNQALELKPDDADAKALYQGILASLDSVNQVVRFNAVTTLVDVPETASRLGRLVVSGINLFFLDAGQNRVYKYLLSGSGAPPIQKLDVNPVLVRKGDEVGNVVAGDLMDIVWMPGGGVRTAARFLALESGGNLLEYDPTVGMRSLFVRDSQTWRKVKAISSFQGNLYVMDTQANSILKYEPTSRGYENSPVPWLKTNVDLTNMVDIAIDGDVYLLGLDGKIQRFRGGLALPYTQPDLDVPISNPAGLFTSPNVNSLYVVDPGNKRIVQLGKEGGFQRQYRYGGKDGAFDALRSVHVDEQQGLMFVTSGKQVLAVSIPR